MTGPTAPGFYWTKDPECCDRPECSGWVVVQVATFSDGTLKAWAPALAVPFSEPGRHSWEEGVWVGPLPLPDEGVTPDV